MFDPIEFVLFLRNRWMVFAVSGTFALVLALAISLTLPKRYTATTEILIEAPGGNDPRAATVISPAYLESLKAYERLAGSDSVFLKAVEFAHPNGQEAHLSVEALKRRVLKVSKLANTAVLDISVTMTDPKAAQALAQNVAEQTIELSRSMDGLSQNDLTRGLKDQIDVAANRLNTARKLDTAAGRTESVEGLETEMQSDSDLALKLGTDLASARADLAGFAAQLKLIPPTKPEELELMRSEIAATEARVEATAKEQNDLRARMALKASQLEQWKSHRAAIEADEKAALAAYETANSRMNDAFTSFQYRGERLRLVDPGIVPQSPGSPNIPLNLIGALILAAAASFVYLAASFAYRRMATREVERVYSLGR